MKQLSLVALTLFSCTLTRGVAGQFGGHAPWPTPVPPAPQALPIVPPPVDHPAYLAQPGMQKELPAPVPAQAEGGGMGPAGPGCPAPDPAEERARAFLEKRIAGRDLRKSVDRVLKGLRWHERIDDAKAEAAARGRPLLWIQALGEVDGFA